MVRLYPERTVDRTEISTRVRKRVAGKCIIYGDRRGKKHYHPQLLRSCLASLNFNHNVEVVSCDYNIIFCMI